MKLFPLWPIIMNSLYAAWCKITNFTFFDVNNGNNNRNSNIIDSSNSSE